MDPRLYPSASTPIPDLGATITVSAEDTNVRQIAVQLKGADGANLRYKAMVLAVVTLDGVGDAFVTTGGSTGIELGAGGNGAILALVAKKVFLCLTEANGLLDLKWTDTGSEAAYLNIVTPAGKFITGAALANT